MIKYTVLLMILACRIVYQASDTFDFAPFSSPETIQPLPSAPPAKLLKIDGRKVNNKIVLDWIVSENETADQFIVEKSEDGKNFITAALVFGTDRPAEGKYQFYEKAGNQKVSYRIKLVNKDRRVEYSEVIDIKPSA